VSYYSGPPSDHFDGTRFFNPGHPDTDRSLAQVLRWKWGERAARWPKAVPVRQVVPDSRVDGLRVTMIGHASVLIQLAGRNILVDPVWSTRASPLRRVGPKRVTAPGIAFDDLPPIDTVLLTHNHYDHMDADTLGRLWQRHRARVIAPLGNDAVLARAVPGMAVETGDWWDTLPLGDDASVTLVPANHWSARTALDRRKALWSGFYLTHPAARVHVCGDTGYGDGHVFRAIRERLGAPDLAILPIGAYAPRWFMAAQHVDPAEAVAILLDLEASHAVGVHWGTFQLTDEARDAPVAALAEALAARRLPADRFMPLSPGDSWNPAPEGSQSKSVL
jgi:L-ascorbate metabolism protein UlaG (beta-lactamase superfamily)